MSSFNCPTCGLPCLDTRQGYSVGCKHHPPDGVYRGKFKECLTCGRVAKDVWDRRYITSLADFPARWVCHSCYEVEQHQTEDF